MNLSRFSVNRPVFTVMACLIVILMGGISLTRLPVDLMPDISYPTLSVSTRYENASPEEIEELVTRPIEEAMSAVPGVEEVSSTSSEGSSNVRVTFSWGVDLDAASNDVRDRLDRVIPRLPDDADRPSLRKFDLASFPIVILGASSRLDPVQMRRLIDEEVKYRLERVPGVAALDVWGGLEREIHVNLDADKLRALGIPLDQLLARIRAANITLPAGSIEAGQYDITLRTLGEYTDLDQLRQTTIAVPNGTPVLLGNVAEVTDSWQKITRIVKVNGEPGVRLSVNKQSGTNTVEVAELVLAEVAKVNEDIPQIRLTPIIDTSDYIRRSITNTGSAALYGGLFALGILFLFLRSLRSTAIIGVAIPVSIVGTFALIYFNGFTLNLMTLGGLALGVGMLLDSAIVVLENIHHLRESGVPPREAAVQGARQMTAPIVASTLTTLAVFLPLVLVRGMAGIMFKQLAMVVSFALLCALGVALTLIPMLSSRFMKIGRQTQAGHPDTPAPPKHGFLSSLEGTYSALLHSALRHRFLTIFLSLAILGASLLLIPWVGTELMPQSDEGEVRVDIEMEVGTRLGVSELTVDQVEEIVRRKVPEIKSIVSSVGGSSWRGGGGHEGSLRVALVPQAERERSSEDIAADLRPALSSVPGATIRTRAGQGLFILRRVSGGSERVEVEVRGFDLETADRVAQSVRRIVEDVPGVTDTVLSREIGSPERIITVDRSKAEAMHVSVRQVADVLQTALSGSTAGYFREAGDEFAIRVQLEDAEKRSLREILDLTLTNSEGQAVVLRNIVEERERSGPVLIERMDQERIVTVRANIQGRDMGSILADIQQGLRSLPVPRGFSVGLSGDYEEQQKAFSELRIGFILALILVYMVMACLYESLRDPFVVMFSVPLAAIGVVLMLFLTGTTFNLQSYIGCIMLGGIVVNNAILLVDYTNHLRRDQGLPLYEALEEAGRRRLRPILMTALTTICGLIPLALGLGEGGEAQAPMARTVIGGLASSTLITLVFVPIVYSFIGDRPEKEEKVV
ncbi:efflux RND transporter permease subunit [bacterium]|nr:efflux RND transporter permease subunit [bacterium]